MIHIGSKIEEIIKIKKVSISDFAKSINKSRTVVYNIFERESIDSNLLYEISKTLEYNFFNCYFPNLEVKEAVGSNLKSWKLKYYNLLEKHSEVLEKLLKK